MLYICYIYILKSLEITKHHFLNQVTCNCHVHFISVHIISIMQDRRRQLQETNHHRRVSWKFVKSSLKSTNCRFTY